MKSPGVSRVGRCLHNRDRREFVKTRSLASVPAKLRNTSESLFPERMRACAWVRRVHGTRVILGLGLERRWQHATVRRVSLETSSGTGAA